jgi:hypothetical protein
MEETNMKKRGLALLLAVMLLASFCAVTAFAENPSSNCGSDCGHNSCSSDGECYCESYDGNYADYEEKNDICDNCKTEIGKAMKNQQPAAAKEAVKTSTGSSGGETLSVIYKLEPNPVAVDGESTVAVTTDGPEAKFKFIRIDGYLVDSADVAMSGDELTIAAAALTSLKDGDHRIDAVFTDGKAVGTLTLARTAAPVVSDAPVSNPSTGAVL